MVGAEEGRGGRAGRKHAGLKRDKLFRQTIFSDIQTIS